MNETITLRWSTGSMELVPPMLLTLSAAQLKKIVQTATLNADEVKTEIAGYIQGEIEQLNPKSEYDKRTIVQYKKLIEACGERKQSKQEKAIKRIVDSVDDCRPQFNGMFQNDGKYCICTGYMAIRSSAPFYGIDEKENNFDMSKAFGNISAYSMPLELPSVKELKSDMKIARIGNTTAGHVRAVRLSKTRCNYLYDFGYGLPLVNAKYLVDMLEALPDCKAFCNPDNNTFSLVYFVSGENDGILLPMRKGIEWEASPEEKPIEQAAPAVEETPIEKPVEAAVEEVKEDPAPVEKPVEEVNKTSAPVQDVPTVKNLSQFKKAISAGYAFKIVNHFVKPELSGQIRQPNKVQTNAFYSVVYGEPDNPVSLANDGKGYYLNYGKAGDWDFTGDTIKMYVSGKPVWEISFDLHYGEPDDFNDINVEEVKAALEESKTHESAFVAQVRADVEAIAKDEQAETTAHAPDNPAPVAPSTPVQAAQGKTTQEERQIVTAINPAFLRLFCASVRDRCRPDGNGLDRTKPDWSGHGGVSPGWTVDGNVMYNTS